MLRGENIVCGTSTTGTGTLTLAATPVAPGGIDFDVLARATGIGFGNSAAVLVSYTIIEYTDTTFATAKSTEKGIGTLTLGGSSGITNCTLARTTVQVTATNLNSQPATYNTNAPTAFSIGTAANVLVFIGAAAADVPAYEPYFSTNGDNLGVVPFLGATNDSTLGLTTGQTVYIPFDWTCPMLVKKVSARTNSPAYTGGTQEFDVSIYAYGTDGKPGKLLIDFGKVGSTTPFASTLTMISSAVHASGYFLTPGRYFFRYIATFTGGSGSVNMCAGFLRGTITSVGGSGSLSGFVYFTATGGSAGAAPDPANVATYTGQNGNNVNVIFALAPS